MHGNDRNPTLLRCQGFLKIQCLLVLSTGWIPERGCAWPVCLLSWLVGLFLSYSFLKFDGTPLFSIRVNPELVAKQGKLASLPLGSWGRTDSGCPCPHMHRGRSPFPTRWSRLPSCLRSAKLPWLPQRAGEQLWAELLHMVDAVTCRDVFENTEVKGNLAAGHRQVTCSDKARSWGTDHCRACYGISDPVCFCCCCFGHILDYFFLLIMYNPLWQKKQEWEWQGDSIIQMAFHTSIDSSRINDPERQGSFIYFASKIFFCKMNNN